VATWCRVALVSRDGATLGAWHLSGAGQPDLSVVEQLARLQLCASRRGGHVALSEVCAELRSLLELAALWEVCGQPEQGEQPLRGQEAVEAADAPPRHLDHL
jgi:hypothetical protein